MGGALQFQLRTHARRTLQELDRVLDAAYGAPLEIAAWLRALARKWGSGEDTEGLTLRELSIAQFALAAAAEELLEAAE